MSSALTSSELTVAATHLVAAKHFQLAGFIVLIYDHALTFSEEVNRIWKKKLTGASILFLINRYATLLQFIIIIIAFHDPSIGTTICKRFAPFEGASTVALIAVCELIMIIRVYALYGRSLYVLSFLMVLWIAQIVISSIGMETGFPAPLPPGLVGCIYTGTSPLFPSLWVAPLISDSCMFLLTLLRTGHYLRRSGTAPTLHIFFRDGLMYYLVILIVNLMNTLIYFTAANDLKAIGASFSQLMTSVMISRLVLNLRSAFQGPGLGESHQAYPPDPRTFMSRTIGNLGEDVRDGWEVHGRIREHDEGIPMVDSNNFKRRDYAVA